jgi:hypothetical protein
MSFDKSSTNIVLIEPSQKIKVFISNLCVRMDFISNFSTQADLLDYHEIKEASLELKNISLTFIVKLEAQNDTKSMRIIVD